MGEGLVSRDSDKAPCVFETYDDIESEAGARFIQATADKAAVQTAIAAGQSRAEALEPYVGDAAFEQWYASFCQQLQAAAEGTE